MNKFKQMFTVAFTILMIASLSATIKLPPIEEKTMSNGLEVTFIENHELPIIELRMVFKSGSAYDPAGKAGLAAFTADLLRKGTKNKTAPEIAEAIDFVGGGIGSRTDRDATTISVTVLKKHLDVGLDIFSDVILNPIFDSEEIERERKQKLAQLQQAKDNSSALCTRGFEKILFDDHPYSDPTSGTEQSIAGMAREDILGFYENYYNPGNAFLIVSGDVEPGKIFKALKKRFEKWEASDFKTLTISSPERPSAREILLIDKPDATQSYIRFGHIGINRQNPDYYALMLMNYTLGSSFTSRLMQTVRVEKGLTYDIRSVNQFNLVPAAYYCNTFTENDSTLLTIEAALAEYDRMKEGGVTDLEFEEAVNFFSGYYPMSLETIDDVADEMVKVKLYGLPVTYIEEFAGNIQSVTRDQILAAAKKYLETENIVFCIVSKADDVEGMLQKLGPVTRITVDEL